MAHLVRIVDDLLDVSRITQGKVELRKETLELQAIVKAAVELAQPTIDAAGHTLSVSLPAEVVRFQADPVRMTQILVNLLNNAVKFTPPGGHIWLVAELTGEHEGRLDQLRIRVRDTGIGIAPEVLPKIFEMFVQGDRSLEKTRGGLGVGLTLVRNLLALHGGTIDVYSAGLGMGSEFVVSLPIDPSAQPPLAAPEPRTPTHASNTRRILVADDNKDGREMLSFFLRAEGHTVLAAHNGRDALVKLAEFKPDTAVIDIGMPGLNGYELAERLRSEPANRSMILIALSGFGREEDKAKASKAGFDQHFTKPVDINALTTFLANVPKK
jgi:CheY-like chemotaxis protein